MAKKKKKLDPFQQMTAVLDFVRKYKKEDGAELCGSMTRLPNKRSEPGDDSMIIMYSLLSDYKPSDKSPEVYPAGTDQKKEINPKSRFY